MADARAKLGLKGERLAEKYLKLSGLKLLARRFAAPVGEIDLIMRDGRTIVFVEVKTLTDRRFQDPQDQVTPAKQRKLLKTAQLYLHAHKLEDRPCRFDVTAVVIPEQGEVEIEHFEDAFLPPR